MDDVLFVLVKDAAEIQKTIRNNEKKIAYIDLEAEIATKERQKKHMQQNIIQNNENIERLKEQNEGLSNKITAAADEIDRLLRDKANLAKEIS
jgi:predicted RNase H-like nuclease (RuvC/YqgF family)